MVIDLLCFVSLQKCGVCIEGTEQTGPTYIWQGSVFKIVTSDLFVELGELQLNALDKWCEALSSRSAGAARLSRMI